MATIRGGFGQQAVEPGGAVEAVGAAFVDPADLAQARLDDIAEGGEGFRREGLRSQRLGSDDAHRCLPTAKRRSSVPTMRTIGSNISR